jgi:hypothetical protein
VTQVRSAGGVDLTQGACPRTDEPGPSGEQPSQPLPQHPHVEALKPDPAQPAQRLTGLTGLPGDSDRTGYQRLYLTAKLDYYAEFPVSDIVSTVDVPADQSPFPGLAATTVSIRRDAVIAYTWVKSPQPVDEFDLDVRLGAAAAQPAAGAAPGLPGPTYTCATCLAATCTCNTRCGQNTCANTCPNTCADTCPNTCANTCATCATNCGQGTCADTCATCFTKCGQGTCADTCWTGCNQNTCMFTCADPCL